MSPLSFPIWSHPFDFVGSLPMAADMGHYSLFDNPDVVYLILSCLSPDADGLEIYQEEARSRSKSLARCARVCRGLHLPSLRILWRRLQDTFPLLNLFTGLHAVKAEAVRGVVDLYVSQNTFVK